MAERWATFDCYGTLVDWNEGIRRELERLLGDGRGGSLLARYHELEPRIQADDPTLSYRGVLAAALRQLAREEGAELASGDADALARSLPDWPVFPDVPAALAEARERGWRLCILSNSDRDLIEASIERIGVPFDRAIVASEIGSYKPSHGHWRAFATAVGRLPDVHVAASLYHDIAPARELGIPAVWINRLDEPTDLRPERELTTLAGLAEHLDAVVPA